MHDLAGKKILILATNGFEQSELEIPRDRLEQAGATVDVVSPETGEIRGWEKKDWGRPVKVDRSLDEARADDYAAIVLPGVRSTPTFSASMTRRLLSSRRSPTSRRSLPRSATDLGS